MEVPTHRRRGWQLWNAFNHNDVAKTTTEGGGCSSSHSTQFQSQAACLLVISLVYDLPAEGL